SPAPPPCPASATASARTSTLPLHDALPICLRQLAEHDGTRRLEARELPPAELDQLVLGHLRARFELNERTGCLAPFLVRPCDDRSEEHTSELQSHLNLVCRLLLEKINHI